MNAKSMNTANATCKDVPQVVDRHVQPVTDPMMVYSGCYCNVSVNFYAFNAKLPTVSGSGALVSIDPAE